MRNHDHYDDLYSFQKEGVEFLRNRRTALLADDMGTGKSAQAIVAAQSVAANNILIITPATIKHNWRKECVKWGYKYTDCLVIDKKTINDIKGHTGIFIINYDLIHRRPYVKPLTKKRYDVLIVDECHYAKNQNALRTKALYNAGGYVDLSIHTWMLSGTPVLNRPVELHPMLRKLAPQLLGDFTNYIAFTRRYCQGYNGKWGWDASGASNVDELAGRLSRFMLRRTKDCLADLPERILRPIYLPITPQIEQHLFKERSGDESARKLLGTAKVLDVSKHVRDILETEDKVIVFAYHVDVIDTLNKLLKEFCPVVIQGSVPSGKRQGLIDTFVNVPACRVFIGQIDAAGEGIDGLQGVCSNIVFAEMHYVPGKNLQAIGRVHRNGQKKKVVVDFLFVEGSMDEQVFEKNLKKAEVIKTLTGDKEELFIIETVKQNEGVKMQGTQIDQTKATAVVTVELSEYSTAKVMDAATLLEKMGYVSNIAITFGVNTAQGKATPEVKDEIMLADEPVVVEKKAAPKKARRKKEPVEAIPEPEVEVVTTGRKELPYEEYVSQVANKISTAVGKTDPSKINEHFAEINTRFTRMFPQHSQVFDVKDQVERSQVKEMLTSYLIEKGLV